MRLRKVVVAVFLGIVLVTFAVILASESAPSNTVGFFTFQIDDGAP